MEGYVFFCYIVGSLLPLPPASHTVVIQQYSSSEAAVGYHSFSARQGHTRPHHGGGLQHSRPQSNFGDKPLRTRTVRQQNGTAIPRGAIQHTPTGMKFPSGDP